MLFTHAENETEKNGGQNHETIPAGNLRGAAATAGTTDAIAQAIVEELVLILGMIILTGIIINTTVSNSFM